MTGQFGSIYSSFIYLLYSRAGQSVFHVPVSVYDRTLSLSDDRIMVLDAGEIRELAPPQELLADKESIFYSLADQAGAVFS